MYNAHPYFFLKNLGKKVHIIHGKIQSMKQYSGIILSSSVRPAAPGEGEVKGVDVKL